MPNVFRLVRRDDTDTIATLAYLLSEAREGRIAGLALTYRDSRGHEEAAFTGAYRAHPDKALSAAMRLSWQFTLAEN